MGGEKSYRDNPEPALLSLGDDTPTAIRKRGGGIPLLVARSRAAAWAACLRRNPNGNSGSTLMINR
jgi:hypothetical protein